jgi:serine/threonine protein phosphatase PrpC
VCVSVVVQVEVGPYRILPGGISVSRTIGDLTLKDPALGVVHSDQLVINEPECICLPRHPDDQLVLVASDGFWDACPDNQTAVDLVHELLLERDTLAEVSTPTSQLLLLLFVDINQNG